MEVEAACILRSCSEVRGLRYTGFLSDGDSKAYNDVVKLDVCDVPIVKDKSVNNVHKRMGTAMRNLTKQKMLGEYHKLHGAVALAIAAFNEGAVHLSQVLQSLAIESNQVMNLYIEETDRLRVMKSKDSSTEVVKRQRTEKWVENRRERHVVEEE